MAGTPYFHPSRLNFRVSVYSRGAELQPWFQGMGKQTCPKAMEIPLLCLASRGPEGLCGSTFSMTNIFHGAASTLNFFLPSCWLIFLIASASSASITMYYWSLPALWTRDFYLPAPLLLMPRYWRLRPERPNSPQGQWPPEPCTSISWGWLRGRGDLLSTHSQ